MKFLSVVDDTRTLRLIKISQALQLSRCLPPASSKSIVDLSKAVRLMLESGEQELAIATLKQIKSVARTQEQDSEGSEFREPIEALLRHVSALHTALIKPPLRAK